MPAIKFSKRQLELYTMTNTKKQKVLLSKIEGGDTSKVRTFIINIVEQSFREYARERGCKKEMEDKEWSLFRKYLGKNL